MNVSREITFDAPPAVIAIAVISLPVVTVLAVSAWRRSGFDRRLGFLELLRVVIVLLAVLTLCQPEWREVFQPTERPVLALVIDESSSMETRDVVDPDDPRAATMRAVSHCRSGDRDAGLPKLPSMDRHSDMTSATLGSTGVVAR